MTSSVHELGPGLEFDEEALFEAGAEFLEDEERELSPDDTDFVERMVDNLMLFANKIGGDPLYPYQEDFARRIFESLILNDGSVITALWSRQAGKTQVVAYVIATVMIIFPKLAAMYPDWFGQYKRGMLVGTFAPIESQAETLFQRVQLVLSSPEAQDILGDDEIGEKVVITGKLITLKGSGSFCRMQTANPKAQVESKTYHLIIIDECQGASDVMVNKSILPMLASTNGTAVYTGTPTNKKNVFYEQIQINKRRDVKGGVTSLNHFQHDWKSCARYNPRYKKYVQSTMARVGADSDEFLLCVGPDTRVLTADLRHIPASEVRVGMKLVGFDEERPGNGLHRQLRETVVEAVSYPTLPCYELVFDDGTKVVCSAEHRWLVTTAGRRTLWKTTEELNHPRYEGQKWPNDRVFKITDVWEGIASWKAGYLAAAFDGEGHYSNTGHQLGFSQNDNSMLSQVQEYLEDFGYGYTVNSDRKCKRVMLTGGRATAMKFLGQMRPERLLAGLDIDVAGSIGRHDHVGQDFQHPELVTKTFLGEQPTVAFRTSTRTFVAEGLASHNSYALKWLLERGMFTTAERLDQLGDTSMQQLVTRYYASPIILGVDPARKQDSTVVTAVWVDWDNPDEFGYYDHRILNWMELHGDRWEDQYARIVDFASNYNVLAVAVDGSGVGDVVGERLSLLMPRSQVLCLSSNVPDQSARWKHMQELMNRGLVAWPAGHGVRKKRVYRRFIQQMEDLEKEWRGPNMLAAAPKVQGAFDDYCDSLCLALFLTKSVTLPEVEQGINPFYR